ncbi:MAG: riboflavin biosynthesis protein RibF [Bacteroidales bacterium]|nr:riboflavin biosynthesis protein RibF [Bacteroidales bacterium]
MVIATGFFDGVHIGHREVIGQLVASAKTRGEESMVVSFWPHPRTVLRKEARTLRLLSSLQEKKEQLKALGVDHVEILPFTREFASLTMEEFLREYIIGKFGGTAVMIGYDNRMGSDCTDPSQLAATARRIGLEVLATSMVPSEGGWAVSSTKIRAAIEAGDMESATKMLGSPYTLFGVVVAGNRLGRTIGFPTANMQLYEPLKLVPANGVYLVKVDTCGEQRFGMCNIGVRPTVGSGNARTIETNIFDFDDEIYGLDIRLTFLRHIREEREFENLAALGKQLEIDRTECLKYI